MKKLLCLFVAFVMIFSMIGPIALADEETPEDTDWGGHPCDRPAGTPTTRYMTAYDKDGVEFDVRVDLYEVQYGVACLVYTKGPGEEHYHFRDRWDPHPTPIPPCQKFTQEEPYISWFQR